MLDDVFLLTIWKDMLSIPRRITLASSHSHTRTRQLPRSVLDSSHSKCRRSFVIEKMNHFLRIATIWWSLLLFILYIILYLRFIWYDSTADLRAKWITSCQKLAGKNTSKKPHPRPSGRRCRGYFLCDIKKVTDFFKFKTRAIVSTENSTDHKTLNTTGDLLHDTASRSARTRHNVHV